MAISINSEYIVVEDVTLSTVTIRFHKDADHRERYKTGTENKYEFTRQETRNVPVDLNAMADDTKSIRHNNIVAWYSALKTLPEFESALDII